MVYILDGEAEITICGQPQTGVTDEKLIMPTNIAYVLQAEAPSKMLLVMIRRIKYPQTILGQLNDYE